MTHAAALDLGTTSIKACLIGGDGRPTKLLSAPAPEILCAGGRYESSASAYLDSAEGLLERLPKPAGETPLGLSCQRSSFLVWESGTGAAVTKLISWQDRRGEEFCRALKGSEPQVRRLTGLRLTPYYFAPKVAGLLATRPDLRRGLENGRLLIGTLDSFFIWRWTGGAHHVTDASMAARTLLLDIHAGNWSRELCALFGIPMSSLPQLVPSTGLGLRLNNGFMLEASMADQSAAFLSVAGQGDGGVLANLGTGCFVLARLPERARRIPEGYLTTLISLDSETGPVFAAEGTLNSTASALKDYPVGECRPDDLNGAENVYCIAEPSGLGAPYFRGGPGVVFSRSTDSLPRRQIAALLLEGIAFRVARILEDFNETIGVRCVYLSGGLSELPLLGQGIAWCSRAEVRRLSDKEASLLGAAFQAARLGGQIAVKTDKLSNSGAPSGFLAKYRRWKKWLDGLLAE
ncbi:MAG: FGGY family carbohydrate kinase [Gammaproteobacteria bacterium]